MNELIKKSVSLPGSTFETAISSRLSVLNARNLERNATEDQVLFYEEEIVFITGQQRTIKRLYVRRPGEKYVGVGWVINEDIDFCMICSKQFGFFLYRHHCRSCGNLVCDGCSPYLFLLEELAAEGEQRVCVQCYWGQDPVHVARWRLNSEYGDDFEDRFEDDESDGVDSPPSSKSASLTKDIEFQTPDNSRLVPNSSTPTAISQNPPLQPLPQIVNVTSMQSPSVDRSPSTPSVNSSGPTTRTSVSSTKAGPVPVSANRSSSSQAADIRTAVSFVPIPGVVVKSKNDAGEKIFINVCHSSLVPSILPSALWRPQNPKQKVDHAINIVIGSIRDTTDKSGEQSKLVDVAVNSDTFTEYIKDTALGEKMIYQVLRVVGSALGDQLSDEFKTPKTPNNYKGGPVVLPITLSGPPVNAASNEVSDDEFNSDDDVEDEDDSDNDVSVPAKRRGSAFLDIQEVFSGEKSAKTVNNKVSFAGPASSSSSVPRMTVAEKILAAEREKKAAASQKVKEEADRKEQERLHEEEQIRRRNEQLSKEAEKDARKKEEQILAFQAAERAEKLKREKILAAAQAAEEAAAVLEAEQRAVEKLRLEQEVEQERERKRDEEIQAERRRQQEERENIERIMEAERQEKARIQLAKEQEEKAKARERHAQEQRLQAEREKELARQRAEAEMKLKLAKEQEERERELARQRAEAEMQLKLAKEQEERERELARQRAEAEMKLKLAREQEEREQELARQLAEAEMQLKLAKEQEERERELARQRAEAEMKLKLAREQEEREQELARQRAEAEMQLKLAKEQEEREREQARQRAEAEIRLKLAKDKEERERELARQLQVREQEERERELFRQRAEAEMQVKLAKEQEERERELARQRAEAEMKLKLAREQEEREQELARQRAEAEMKRKLAKEQEERERELARQRAEAEMKLKLAREQEERERELARQRAEAEMQLKLAKEQEERERELGRQRAEAEMKLKLAREEEERERELARQRAEVEADLRKQHEEEVARVAQEEARRKIEEKKDTDAVEEAITLEASRSRLGSTESVDSNIPSATAETGAAVTRDSDEELDPVGDGDAVSENIVIQPIPGIVLKTKTKKTGIKFFINLCHHELVPLTCAEGLMDSITSRLSSSSRGSFSETNLLVVVGECRETTDKSGDVSILVDAVINSGKFKQCMEDEETNAKDKLCLRVIKSVGKSQNELLDDDYKTPKTRDNYKSSEGSSTVLSIDITGYVNGASSRSGSARGSTLGILSAASSSNLTSRLSGLLGKQSEVQVLPSVAPVTYASAEDQTKWSPLLARGERVIATGAVGKKNPMGLTQTRQLILTDGPRLLYADPKSLALKGEVECPLGIPPMAVLYNSSTVDVKTSNRVYRFIDADKGAKFWVDKINSTFKAFK